MLRPNAEQLQSLGRFERVAFELCDQFNRRPLLKRAAHVYLRTFGAGWVTECTRNLLHVEGLENLPREAPASGLLLASNHRSFFDLYVVTAVLLRNTDWVRGMYFPVRSTFFYEGPVGIGVNAVMSALAMYPPILRESSKRSFNQYAVEVLADLSRVPGSVIGIHPEGTRNKTDDPYTLLPAQPGVGQVAYHARPAVLPVFILGTGNNFVRQVKGNFDGTGDPITIVFGKVQSFESYYDEKPRLRTYKRIADRLAEEITLLGQQEKSFRARLGLPSMAPRPPSVAPAAGARPKKSDEAA